MFVLGSEYIPLWIWGLTYIYYIDVTVTYLELGSGE